MNFSDLIYNITSISPKYELIVAIITAVFVLYSIDTIIRFIFSGIEYIIYKGRK